MAATIEQARYITKNFLPRNTDEKTLEFANVMREHGTRLDVVEKNIHKRVYAINAVQAQFLPEMYRPPPNCLEDLIRVDGDNS
jgi:hypothetical protein